MFPSFYVIYLIFIAAGFVAGLLRFRRTVLYVVVLLGITFCSEIASRFIGAEYKNNSPLYHIYQPVQAILWAGFFHQHIAGKARRLVFPLLSALLVFGLINVLLWQPPKVFPSYFIIFESVLMALWSFTLFLQMLDRPASENIFRNSVFIITISVLWFSLLTFAFFTLHNYFIEQRISHDIMKWLHRIANYVYYLLLLVAMLQTPKKEMYGG